MTLAAPTSSTAGVELPDRARSRLRAALGRPRGAFPATRWLFARLALLSLAVTLPVSLLTTTVNGALVVLAGSLVIAASLTVGYLLGRTSLAGDLADTAAVFVMALASNVPSTVVAVLVSVLWFRSLDGSALRAYLRPVGYSLVLGAALLVWPQLGGELSRIEAAHAFATVPMLFLTVVVARRLAWIFREREIREAVANVYAVAIEQLLGLTDPAAIQQVAEVADDGLCAVVPGLRIAKADLVGDQLLVRCGHGHWADRPERLPAQVVAGASAVRGPVEDQVTDPALLDGAVDARCAWVALSLPVVPILGVRSWLLVGAPRRVPRSVVRTLKNLGNHMAMAFTVAEAYEALTERAMTDALTGVANRAAFTAALESALADESLCHVSVLFVDMDDFKEINDRLGHEAGDQVLREVAGRLRRSSRPGDLCGRLGGDEFAVLLPGADARTAGIVAERVAAAVRSPLRRAGDVVVELSASVGCATAPTGTPPDALLRQADAAMYDAKRGR